MNQTEMQQDIEEGHDMVGSLHEPNWDAARLWGMTW